MNGNYVAVANGPLSTLRLSTLTSTENLYGVASVSGGLVYSYGNNRLEGNKTANLAPGTALTPATQQ